MSHMAYSYLSSNFDKAVIVSVDGVGETSTVSFGKGINGVVHNIKTIEYPDSLGLYYSAMTAFLGFKPNEGEYKVMGLASYGNPNVYIDKIRELINYKNSKLTCNMDLFNWNRSNKTMFNEKLVELIGFDQRLPDEPVGPKHMDLAAAVQKRYEEIIFEVLKSISIVISGKNNLCLGGGCAYNGTANGKIIDNSFFNKLWIPPAPSDAGSAIGACLHYLVKNGKLKERVAKNPFLGPMFYYNQIETAIKKSKFYKFASKRTLTNYIAKKLHEGKVIGWYDGHCEFGSRALGNRSILANPTIPGMKDKINKVIKEREGFRPFAPMVIKEKQHEYFDMHDDIPYMNQVVQVKKEYRDKLPSITHVDGTARVQTVYKHTMIYDLLVEFGRLSGYPILLNTSFNIKDKTMVLTPKDAIDTFNDTEMDLLVIGNFIIYK